jgi:hypothetical protein
VQRSPVGLDGSATAVRLGLRETAS